jgi:hypothetical protein
VDGLALAVGVPLTEEAIRELFGGGCEDDPQATARSTSTSANAVLTVMRIQRRTC